MVFISRDPSNACIAVNASFVPGRVVTLLSFALRNMVGAIEKKRVWRHSTPGKQNIIPESTNVTHIPSLQQLPRRARWTRHTVSCCEPGSRFLC